MIDVCVTHFGKKYSKKYIDNLEAGIGKNYSGDFNLIVKTDCPNQHWDKISFFKCDKPRVVMDIDMLVVGNLDRLFDFETDSLAAFQRWWSADKQCINGGFYKIAPGPKLDYVYDKFYKSPERIIKKYGDRVGTPWKGEQSFVNDNIINKSALPNHWLGIYADKCIHNDKSIDQDTFNKSYTEQFSKSMMRPSGRLFGATVKLVHFIYDDNNIERHPSWIKDMWDTPRTYV